MKIPREMRLYFRFGQFLFWEFRWALGVFWGLVLVGGLALHWGYDQPLSFGKACNTAFFLLFAQPSIEYPQNWAVQPLFFLLPILGIGAVADSMVRLGYLVFASKSNIPEWQIVVASLYRKHVIVVGAGKVGFRIVRGLRALRESVVAVESDSDAEFVEELRALGVPVIMGTGRSAKVLEQAGVMHAKGIILATNDDLANLDAALTAHDMNPSLRPVLRLFDESLAAKVTRQFDMQAISTSHVAAPAFIAAATNHKVYHNFHLEGAHLHLTDVRIRGDGALCGRQVGEVQKEFSVNIAMHRGKGGVAVNPPHTTQLSAGDTLLVMAPMTSLVAFEDANEPRERD